jgi:hypothetical protein
MGFRLHMTTTLVFSGAVSGDSWRRVRTVAWYIVVGGSAIYIVSTLPASYTAGDFTLGPHTLHLSVHTLPLERRLLN